MIIEIEKGKNYAARFYYKDVFGKMHRPYKSGFPSRKAAQQWETQERARLDGDPVTTESVQGMAEKPCKTIRLPAHFGKIRRLSSLYIRLPGSSRA